MIYNPQWRKLPLKLNKYTIRHLIYIGGPNFQYITAKKVAIRAHPALA